MKSCIKADEKYSFGCCFGHARTATKSTTRYIERRGPRFSQSPVQPNWCDPHRLPSPPPYFCLCVVDYYCFSDPELASAMMHMSIFAFQISSPLFLSTFPEVNMFSEHVMMGAHAEQNGRLMCLSTAFSLSSSLTRKLLER